MALIPLWAGYTTCSAFCLKGKRQMGANAMSDDGTSQPPDERFFDEPPIYDWQPACFAALNEKDPSKLPVLLRMANDAIQQRLSRLEPWPDGREMEALNQVVQALGVLRERSSEGRETGR
jgi:hypothetical protein